MNNKILLVIIAFLWCGIVHSQTQTWQPTLFFKTDEMPNLLKCLPAPPDTNSAEFANDIMRYMWGKSQRLDSARAAIVKRDAVWNLDSLFAEFAVPFGVEISLQNSPEIYKFLVNGVATVDQMRVAPKAFYMRKRPFVRFQEHLLTEEEEVYLRNEGSYPSGHSMRGWSVALLLSEINPMNADTIMARGFMYGESRVITGAHWQSDVDASRLGASIGVARLHTNTDFLNQLHQAQLEFQRLKNNKVAPKAKQKNDTKRN